MLKTLQKGGFCSFDACTSIQNERNLWQNLIGLWVTFYKFDVLI